MRDIEIALAVSTRQWSEHLHRFLVDHGGARVRLHVMQPGDAFSERFDVLLIDDICSFLSPHLVEKLNRADRRVVGVYDPDEFPDGKDRLLACDVTEVIEAHADPEEFLALVGQLGVTREAEGSSGMEVGNVLSAEVESERLHPLVAVGSPPGGADPPKWRSARPGGWPSDAKRWAYSTWISGRRRWPSDWDWVCILTS